MADLDELVTELTPDLMCDRARSLDRLHVKNNIGGHPGLEELTDAEYEELLTRIVDAAEQADITIDL